MRKDRPVIYYNINESPFKIKIGELAYYFSSEYHRDNFMGRLEDVRADVRRTMSNRFKMDVHCDILADMRLYLKIETRGFKVVHTPTGEVFTCPNQITLILNGVNRIERNCAV